jgi:hypothetical protein
MDTVSDEHTNECARRLLLAERYHWVKTEDMQRYLLAEKEMEQQITKFVEFVVDFWVGKVRAWEEMGQWIIDCSESCLFRVIAIACLFIFFFFVAILVMRNDLQKRK